MLRNKGSNQRNLVLAFCMIYILHYLNFLKLEVSYIHLFLQSTKMFSRSWLILVSETQKLFKHPNWKTHHCGERLDAFAEDLFSFVHYIFQTL